MTKSTIIGNNNNEKKNRATRISDHSCSCPSCGKSPDEWIGIYYKELAKIEERKKIAYKKGDMIEKFIKEIEAVWGSPKSAVEKKLELFEILEKVDFGELSTSENERVNNLIQSRIYAELAKKYMAEYKKSTAEEFK